MICLVGSCWALENAFLIRLWLFSRNEFLPFKPKQRWWVPLQSNNNTVHCDLIGLREMNMVSLGDTCWRCLLHQKINIQVSDLQSTRNQPEGQLFFMLDMTWVVSYWSYYLLLDWFVISTSVILVNMLATDKLGRSISILPEVKHQSIK